MLEREHIAIDKVYISTFLGRDAVQVLQFPDIVGGHPAVLAGRSIAVHTACIVAAKQSFQIELHKVLLLFILRK